MQAYLREIAIAENTGSLPLFPVGCLQMFPYTTLNVIVSADIGSGNVPPVSFYTAGLR
jgi:hypothetical protein